MCIIFAQSLNTKKQIPKKEKMKFIQPNQKNICCDDIIQCIYELNQLDLAVYNKLKTQKEVRPQNLAKEIKKERSTVYRSLQKLTCTGLIEKNTKTLPKGGNYHTYKIKDSEQTKKQLEKRIDNWYNKMKKTIEKI